MAIWVMFKVLPDDVTKEEKDQSNNIISVSQASREFIS